MKNLKYIVFLLFVLILADCKLFSNVNSPYNFLRIIGSARSASLSGAMLTIENDPSSIFFNPATLYTVSDNEISATFLKNVLDINSGNIIYNFGNSFEDGKLAASINFTNYGSFEYSDLFSRSGTFGGNDITAGVTYSNIIDSNIFYGITPKFVFFSLENSNSLAFALDFGILYKLKDNRTNIGFSILHTGTQITSLGNNTENLPTDVRIGLNHRLKGLPILINLSLIRLADPTDNFGQKFRNIVAGIELSLSKYIDLRFGLDNQIRSNIAQSNNKGISGFSLGFGIKLEDFNIDYGYGQFTPVTALHRFTITTNINNYLD